MQNSKFLIALRLFILFFVFVCVYTNPIFFDTTPEWSIYIVYTLLAGIVIYTGYFTHSVFHSKKIDAFIGAAMVLAGSICVGLIATYFNKVLEDQIPWQDPEFYMGGAIISLIGGLLGYIGSWVYFFLHKKKASRSKRKNH